MLALAILAGIYIALAGVGASCAAVTVESASLAKLVSGCLFPAGLTMVLLAGSELFTGNCLLVMPLAQKAITPAQMLRSWVVVYLGNFIGAMAVAWIASASHTFTLFGDWFAISVVSTAAAKCSLSFTDALLRGILCNLLVCLAVLDQLLRPRAWAERSRGCICPFCCLCCADMSTVWPICITFRRAFLPWLTRPMPKRWRA